MRISRRSSIILHDLVMVALAWEIAWLARFNFAPPPMEYWWANLRSLPLVLLGQGLVSAAFGLYRGVWRFASIRDLWNIIRAAGVGALCVTLVLFIATRLEGVPRSVLMLFPVFLVALLGLPRLAYRIWKDHRFSLRQLSAGSRVIIVGAGHAGEALLRDMLRGADYVPVGFVDDEKRLAQARIHGIPVLGTVDDLARLVTDVSPDFIFIAIPSASNRQMQRIVNACIATGVRTRTLPVTVARRARSLAAVELRDVAIEDLVGRSAVELDWIGISRGLAGRRVLVTGGGGSIGSELCRQIARVGPAQLIVLDQSEYNLYVIDAEIRRSFPDLTYSALLGDVCDEMAMHALAAAYRPDVVFHAAAYKHVPLLERQVREAVRNNVLGTQVIARAVGLYGCREFVLISTDKAVNPTSVMGMCKRAAELVCENLSQRSSTRFITVRFGNVIDSTGSVVPLFREQIRHGGPVTVTHPDVTRYFMTIPEASQLIMQAAVMGEGGEIYVLEMGEPVRILDLAEQMIRLAGKEPGRDIAIDYTGLRPGEKMTEELFYPGEEVVSTGHEKIRLARQRHVDRERVELGISALIDGLRAGDEAQLLARLRELVPEFREPLEDVADLRVVALRSRKVK